MCGVPGSNGKASAREPQEEYKMLKDRYVKKEEEFEKMKEWCEKARDENTESRRKSVSQEGERKESSVESNTAGKKFDNLPGNAEQEDRKIEDLKEQEEKEKGKEGQSRTQETRISELEEQVTDLPDELGEVQAGLQNCKHKASG